MTDQRTNPDLEDEKSCEWSDVSNEADGDDQGENSSKKIKPCKTRKLRNKGQKFKKIRKRKFRKLKIALPKPKRKERKTIDKIEVPEKLKAQLQNEESLEKVQKRLNWSRNQVKTLIRKVVQDPELTKFVLEKAVETPTSEQNNTVQNSSLEESRCTRLKAKTLKKDGMQLHWILQKMEETSGISKKRSSNVSNKFTVTDELPDDQDDDDDEDEDYIPSQDPDASTLPSDNDYDMSEIGTPGEIPESPSPSFYNASCLQTPRILSSSGKNSLFKQPPNSNLKVIMSTSSSNQAKRSLNFDDLPKLDLTNPLFDEENNETSCHSKKLTRPRGVLKDIPIEQVAMKFYPPDITPDMYEAKDHEYYEFCQETFTRPITSQIDTMNEDLTEADFYFHQHEKEEHDVLKEDLKDNMRYNKTTEISKNEVENLVHDLMRDFGFDEAFEAEAPLDYGRIRKKRFVEESRDEFIQNCYKEAQEKEVMNQDEKSILNHQLKQHIQLLTQLTLLSSNCSQFKDANIELKKMTTEIYMKTTGKSNSICNQETLFPGLKLIDEWEKSGHSPSFKSKTYKMETCELSPELMRHIGQSQGIFLYPSLLPSSGLLMKEKPRKFVTYCPSEDHVIALGLERFQNQGKIKKGRRKELTQACKMIARYSLPIKLYIQILKRIQNQQSRKGDDVRNPIIYFIKNGKAPRLPLDYDNFMEIMPKDVMLKNCGSVLMPNCLRHFYSFGTVLGNSKTKAGAEAVVKSAPIEQNASSASVEMIFQFKPGQNQVSFLEQKDIEKVVPNPTISPIKTGSPKQSCSMPKISFIQKSPSKKERDKILRKYSSYKRNRTILPKATPKKRKKQLLPKIEKVEDRIFHAAVEEEPPPPPTAPEALKDNSVVIQSQSDNPEILMGHTLSETVVNSMHPGRDIESSSEVLFQAVIQASHQNETSPNNLMSKRKTKSQREAEMTLMLLEEESENEIVRRREKECAELIAIAQVELGAEKFTQFLKTIICDENDDEIKVFITLHKLCQGHVELQETLLDLLTSNDAKKLGVDVYHQYCSRQKNKAFFRKLKKYYECQPHMYTKIVREISQNMTDPNLSGESLKQLGNRLFKGCQFLYDSFLSLIPQAPTSDSLLPEPEFIDFEKVRSSEFQESEQRNEASDNENEIEEGAPGSKKAWFKDFVGNIQPEEINFHENEDDSYGSESCKCRCHLGAEKVDDGTHCLHCSLIFLNGKVYLRDGKNVRLAKVEYPEGKNPFLNQKTMSKICKTKKTKTPSKDIIQEVSHHLPELGSHFEEIVVIPSMNE